MNSGRSRQWMWADAIGLIDRMERLHQRSYAPTQAGGGTDLRCGLLPALVGHAIAALALLWISGGTRAEMTVYWTPNDEQLENLLRFAEDPAASPEQRSALTA